MESDKTEQLKLVEESETKLRRAAVVSFEDSKEQKLQKQVLEAPPSGKKIVAVEKPHCTAVQRFYPNMRFIRKNVEQSARTANTNNYLEFETLNIDNIEMLSREAEHLEEQFRTPYRVQQQHQQAPQIKSHKYQTNRPTQQQLQQQQKQQQQQTQQHQQHQQQQLQQQIKQVEKQLKLKDQQRRVQHQPPLQRIATSKNVKSRSSTVDGTVVSGGNRLTAATTTDPTDVTLNNNTSVATKRVDFKVEAEVVLSQHEKNLDTEQAAELQPTHCMWRRIAETCAWQICSKAQSSRFGSANIGLTVEFG